MSFDVFKAMAQAYNEHRKEPPLLPATIETIAWAYRQICHGEDPWTALGNFTNAWYGYAKHMRAELISEPLQQPAQETEHTRRWGVFCAASVEYLCNLYHLPCPSWAHDPRYILETPWWYTHQASDPAAQTALRRITPAPFARRNIFCSNRLYQNKYEMYEWMQEAIACGMTDVHEIQRYARQKEIELYGA